jgi:hypothetical protein
MTAGVMEIGAVALAIVCLSALDTVGNMPKRSPASRAGRCAHIIGTKRRRKSHLYLLLAVHPLPLRYKTLDRAGKLSASNGYRYPTTSTHNIY